MPSGSGLLLDLRRAARLGPQLTDDLRSSGTDDHPEVADVKETVELENFLRRVVDFSAEEVPKFPMGGASICNLEQHLERVGRAQNIPFRPIVDVIHHRN